MVHTTHCEQMNLAEFLCNTQIATPPPFPWFKCPEGQVTNQIPLLGSFPAEDTFRGKAKEKMGSTSYRSFWPRGTFSWSVITDELGAGRPHHYVMSEGRRQGEGSETINTPFAHRDTNLPLAFWMSVFWGLPIPGWLFKRLPQIPAHFSGLN